MADEDETWAEWARSMLYYHTVKVVQIRSWKLGALHYGIMFLIAVYVGVYAIWWDRGYQSSGSLVAGTTIKVKGIAEAPDGHVWDAQDAVFPPKEPSAAFVTTNYLLTPRQERTTCTDPEAACPCSNGTYTAAGVETGACNQTASRCIVNTWCPPEKKSSGNLAPHNLLERVGNFTVFIRVNVKFPKYNVALDNANGSKPQMGYNLFTISDMMERAGSKFDADAHRFGAALAAVVEWECDFDHDPQDCVPNVTFVRIDDPDTKSASYGYNFRHARYYRTDPSTLSRDLYKLYGVRVIALVSGHARKFDAVPLFVNIGSGLALLSVATAISDLIVLYLLPNKAFYNKVKFEEVDDRHADDDDDDDDAAFGLINQNEDDAASDTAAGAARGGGRSAGVLLDDSDSDSDGGTSGRRRPPADQHTPLILAESTF